MSNKQSYIASVNIHEDVPSDFPLSRMLHCHNVGLRMYSYAKKHLGWAEEKCQDMYVLGMMHDIGYELNSDPFEHDVAMANALGRSGYKYIDEIYHHSRMQTEYDTPEMRLLYFADMTVDGKGNWVTIEDRLRDLEERHGKDSEVYKESEEIADALAKWGFDDRITEDDYITSISADNKASSDKKSRELPDVSIDNGIQNNGFDISSLR